MIKNNTLSVRFGKDVYSIISQPLYQWDHGITLELFNAPNFVQQAHFAVADVNTSLNVPATVQSGDKITCKIPDALQSQGKPIYCHFYQNSGNSGNTVYTVKIPVIPRAEPTAVVYTEQEQSSYDALASSFNVELQKLNNAMSDIAQVKQDVENLNEEIPLLATKEELADAISDQKIDVTYNNGTVTMASQLFT